MERLHSWLSSAAGRRQMGAVASLAVNAALLVVALLPRTPSVTYSRDASDTETRIVLTLLPAAQPIPRQEPPRRAVERAPRRRSAVALTLPTRQGPPTETADSLRERLAAGDATSDTDGRRSLPCDAGVAGIDRDRPPTAVLVVHIGVDGHVVETEVERSSGDPRIDAALRHCALGWGPFPLAIVDGRILESWQRVAWEPAAAAPTP